MLVEFRGSVEVLRFLERHGYVLHDTEYVCNGDDSWSSTWLHEPRVLRLSTGYNAYTGRLSLPVPRTLDGYSAWLRGLRGEEPDEAGVSSQRRKSKMWIQTDVLAVRDGFMSVFESALGQIESR